MRWSLAIAPLLAAALAVLGASCARREPRPNVLLIVVDTLRADRLGCAGYERETTPNLDRLAARGLRFSHAQSPRAKTTPAVASIMTGRHPHSHGVRDLAIPLPAEVPTLAEHLRANGFETCGIVGNYVMRDELSGLARGFRHWVEDLPDSTGVPPDHVPQRRARSLTDGALRALGLADAPADGAGPRVPVLEVGEPWFLYLHYMDPHGTYDPPPEHDVFRTPEPRASLPYPSPSSGDAWIADYNLLPGDVANGHVDVDRVIDRYDGEVRYADAEIGRLLDALEEAGRLEDTIVVVTSDHGESLGEHDYWFEHGRHAYEATCRVPLLLLLPPAFEAEPGVRRSDVSLADLAPTLCELLRLPRMPRTVAADPTPGRQRIDLLREDGGPSPVFCEKVERFELSNAVQTKGVRIGDWKLLHRYTHVADEELRGEKRMLLLGEELYDLSGDPREANDLAASPPAGAPLERLREELRRFSMADEHFHELARSLQRRRQEVGEEDPEALRVLRALGY